MMLLDSLYAAAATLGFGVLFNIRGRGLGLATLGGGAAWLVYLAVFSMSHGPITSVFISALFIGIYAEATAHVFKKPATLFIVCAIIPLVPGGGMYYSMLYALHGNADTALSTVFQTLYTAGAIAAGVALATSASRGFFSLLAHRKSGRVGKNLLG